MKHLLAAATFAALIAATPAGAQVAYGMTPGESVTTFGVASTGNWRDAVVIYASGNTGSTVLENALAPLASEAGAATPGVSFDLRGGSVGLTGVGGVGTEATAPVPEPATWAMMLVGFGAVGFALRSRRKATLRYA